MENSSVPKLPNQNINQNNSNFSLTSAICSQGNRIIVPNNFNYNNLSGLPHSSSSHSSLQSQTMSMLQHNPNLHYDTSQDYPVSSSPTVRPRECVGCGKPILERYLLETMNQSWHEDCLKCSCCDCRLGEVGSTLYAKANLLLCKRDYLRLFGATGNCAACLKVIPAFEMVMRTKENVYHLECFACQQCNHRFCIGDRYYLYDNRILCELDYEEKFTFNHSNKQKSTNSTATSNKNNSGNNNSTNNFQQVSLTNVSNFNSLNQKNVANLLMTTQNGPPSDMFSRIINNNNNFNTSTNNNNINDDINSYMAAKQRIAAASAVAFNFPAADNNVNNKNNKICNNSIIDNDTSNNNNVNCINNKKFITNSVIDKNNTSIINNAQSNEMINLLSMNGMSAANGLKNIASVK